MGARGVARSRGRFGMRRRRARREEAPRRARSSDQKISGGTGRDLVGEGRGEKAGMEFARDAAPARPRRALGARSREAPRAREAPRRTRPSAPAPMIAASYRTIVDPARSRSAEARAVRNAR